MTGLILIEQLSWCSQVFPDPLPLLAAPFTHVCRVLWDSLRD